MLSVSSNKQSYDLFLQTQNRFQKLKKSDNNLKNSPMVTTMTFNLRNSKLDQGWHDWEKRKREVVKLIQKYDSPSIIGTQECSPSMLQDLFIEFKDTNDTSKGYARVSKHTPRQIPFDEPAILYRKDILQLERSGRLWLSKTPSHPNSISWGSSMPRMAVWALFNTVDSSLTSSKENNSNQILVINTHMDHRSEEARRGGAGVIQRLIAELRGEYGNDTPFLVLGDFNAAPGHSPHSLLTQESIHDAWITCQHERNCVQNTVAASFHAWYGMLFDAPLPRMGQHLVYYWHGRWTWAHWGRYHIDWILHSSHWKPWIVSVVTERKYINGNWRFPSDHFPVIASFQLNLN